MSVMTPMMRQYHDAKSKHPDALLFFRMGDFYEMFHEDAKEASRLLGLTLTSRDKANPIPMAGIPVRSVDTYLRRLLILGRKVAICEQMEDPREAKGIVERAVTRVVTPGTVTEESVLEAKTNNFLASLFPGSSGAGLAWIDVSTGTFLVSEVEQDRVLDELSRIDPSEILIPERLTGDKAEFLEAVRDSIRGTITTRPDWAFEAGEAKRILTTHFGVRSLDGFGCGELTTAIQAAGAVLQYVEETQKTGQAHIARIEKLRDGAHLVLDRTTRRALELTESMGDGSRGGTLLEVLDHTRTAMGGRCLKSWLLAPLMDRAVIRRRLDAVGELVEDSFRRKDLRETLGGIYDLERIAAKVATGRANPRDLVSLRQSAERLPELKARLEGTYAEALAAEGEGLDTIADLGILIGGSLVESPPPNQKDGGFIRDGYHAELDELRSLKRDGKDWIAAFQKAESERTGISNLKVGFNKVFGYYLEISHVHRDRVPAEYHRKQTLKNAERYITPELKEYETKVLTADEKAKDLEAELFVALREEVMKHVPRIQAAAVAVAGVDALASLSEAAALRGYARPEILDTDELDIRDGRHPVLEVSQTDEAFVPNDVLMGTSERRVLVITGPNMSGKSTYLRQTALIVVMAQCGSFVPAQSARIGLADRIFTRVGASDDLSRGKSTFMVEMSETANILNNATSRSLLVLDEIGRGTSTYDGVAIAWAVTEYLSTEIGARTLFATHYHELTEIADRFENVTNLNVAVKEWGSEVIFLRKIGEGGTDRSYGVHVARIAGVPKKVIDQAGEILLRLEEGRRPQGEERTQGEHQLGLFAPAAPPHPVLEELRDIDPDRLTPLEALGRLSTLRDRLLEDPPDKP
jgi:DNA mismatch repair protein MutS